MHGLTAALFSIHMFDVTRHDWHLRCPVRREVGDLGHRALTQSPTAETPFSSLPESHCGQQNNSPLRRCPCLYPDTRKYVTWRDWKNFADVNKLRTLRWGVYAELSRWAPCNHNALYGGHGRSQDQRKSDVMTEAEFRDVLWEWRNTGGLWTLNPLRRRVSTLMFIRKMLTSHYKLRVLNVVSKFWLSVNAA